MSTQEKKDNANYANHFTRNQNILYDSYKHLTKEEKWLYSCLRRLFCEDAKPRYYSLRELASLTDYSVGALSKMLPRLHAVGLIHSEIKRKRTRDGKETGNALYHITIIDIWELNKKFYSCSPNEQVDPSDVLVHEMTQASSRKVTSSLTKSDKPASLGEQDRAQNEPYRSTIRNNHKKYTEEENALSSIDETRTLSRPLVFHPLHDFIALDDAIAPKVMTVFMTPEKYFSEYEDKRRERIASEVHYELQQRGHHVTFKWEQEPESNYKFAPEVVDASQPNSPSSLQETIEESTPAPSDEQESKQAVSHSQSAPHTTAQDSAKQAPTEQTKQPELIERSKKPVMPPESMKWCSEKLVQITEALRGKYFTEKQRQGELKAAKRILDEELLEVQYVQAFCDRNDTWWRETNGLLSVTDMAATPKGKSVMRAVAIWQKLEAREEAAAQKQSTLKEQRDQAGAKAAAHVGANIAPDGSESYRITVDPNRTFNGGLKYLSVPPMPKPERQRGA